MNRHPQQGTLPYPEESLEHADRRLPLLHRRDARRRARRRERIRQDHNQVLARRAQDIFFGRGLSQISFSIGGGRVVRLPQVLSVDDRPPLALVISILPGQTPGDFIAHAPAIAYGLGMTEVRVVPLMPSVIRLELLP